MRVSREQVGENRRRILDEAARLFRERGFEDVSVAEVMKAAGLTHGGFYGHFRSKDDLIAQTLAHALMGSAHEATDLADYAAWYLSPSHRDATAAGCAVAALGSEAARAGPDARAAMTSGLRRQVEQFTRLAAGQDEAARQAAIGSWAAMVGAIVLARLSDDPALSDEVLEATRAWISRPSAPA